MLSFMLCFNMDLNLYIKAQKSSLRLVVPVLYGSRYCWMKSTIPSCLLILGTKKSMLCYLLVCSGHRYKNLAREFVSSVRFFNVLRIAHKHPQDY